jgi:hypothetical protein
MFASEFAWASPFAIVPSQTVVFSHAKRAISRLTNYALTSSHGLKAEDSLLGDQCPDRSTLNALLSNAQYQSKPACRCIHRQQVDRYSFNRLLNVAAA